MVKKYKTFCYEEKQLHFEVHETVLPKEEIYGKFVEKPVCSVKIMEGKCVYGDLSYFDPNFKNLVNYDTRTWFGLRGWGYMKQLAMFLLGEELITPVYIGKCPGVEHAHEDSYDIVVVLSDKGKKYAVRKKNK